MKALALENRDAEAYALLADTGSYEMAASAEMDAINKLVPMKLEEADAQAAADTAKANATITSMIIVTLISLALAIAFGLFYALWISNPLKKANQMIKEMSQGHFTMRLNMNRNDEIGEMAESMDTFSNDIQTVIIGTMNQISNGDVGANVQPRDAEDELSPALS